MTLRITYDGQGPVTGLPYFKVEQRRFGLWWAIARNLTAEQAKRYIRAIQDVYENPA